jgi:aarF domain-containing kinase
MLSGRTWKTIETSISQIRSAEEITTLQDNFVKKRFLKNMSLILSSVPRELLMLMKTNDILRAVDSSLGVQSLSKYSVIRMGAHCSRYIFDESLNQKVIGYNEYFKIFYRYVKDYSWFLLLDLFVTINGDFI